MSRKERSGFRRPGFVASAGFLGCVAFGGAALFLGAGEESVPPTTSQAPDASSVSPGEGAGSCQPDDRDQVIPRTTPSGITWRLLGGIALPYSPAAGPLVVEESGAARCYAHNPLGALLASDQLSVRYLLSPDWRAVARNQVASGPGRDAYLKWRSKEVETAFDSGFAQVAGFRFVAYSSEMAVVEKVMRAPDGALAAFIQTVRWQDGDWRLVLQPDGLANPPGHDVESLDGYAVWGGV